MAGKMSREKSEDSGDFSGQAGRLREARERLGQSQEDLARSLGVSIDRLGRAERGENAVPSEILQALGAKFFVSATWILTGQGPFDWRQAGTPAPREGGLEVPAGPAKADVAGLARRVLDAHEAILEIVRRAAQPEMAWGVSEAAEAGYEEIPAEDVEGPPSRRAGLVPIVDNVAAGAARGTDLAEAYPPGWAESFVRAPGAPKGAFAVRVFGSSMEPDYRDGDLVIVDPRKGRVENGSLAVVVYNDPKSGTRLARFKRIRRAEKVVRLESLNPDYPTAEIPVKALRAAFSIVGHLPQVHRRKAGGQQE